QLDGQPGALDADRAEELVRPRVRLPGRERLHHAAGDRLAVAAELDRHDPGAGLEAHGLEAALLAEDDCRAEYGVPGERELAVRREDPDQRVRGASRRQPDH